MRSVALVCLTLVGACLLVGCDEPQRLTERPLSMDIYVDASFSNDQVAGECIDDIMTAAKLAAGSRGFLEVHTFDGDPFRRRGISAHFDEELPPSVKGTSGEVEYLEREAEDLEGKIRALIHEKAEIGGTPLIAVLERAARNRIRGDLASRLLICTDGLFTDVTPIAMTRTDAESAGWELRPNLRGATVDFIGLDASDPGRGRRIEQTKPLVQALLSSAGAKLGNWNIELASEWRNDVIASVNGDSE